MARYILRRLLQAIPLLLLVSVISFIIMQLAPGGPMAVYLMNPKVTAADIARLEHLYGLDQPLYVQYIKWLWAMLHGNLGFSYKTGQPVLAMILSRLPNTIELMFVAFVLAVVVAIPAGIFSAVRRYTAADHAVTVFTFLGFAIPSFWFGLMLQLLFAVQLGWLPSAGMMTIGEPFSLLDRIRHLIMPAFMLGLLSMAGWTRYMRSSMLDVLHEDYIRTARAKGLPERVVHWKHAVRNSLIPVITIMGLEIPSWFSGAVITETVFAWPGMGRLYLDSVFSRDYPVLMGAVMLTTVMVVVGNLVADVLYGVLDPRIRYE